MPYLAITKYTIILLHAEFMWAHINQNYIFIEKYSIHEQLNQRTSMMDVDSIKLCRCHYINRNCHYRRSRVSRFFFSLDIASNVCRYGVQRIISYILCLCVCVQKLVLFLHIFFFLQINTEIKVCLQMCLDFEVFECKKKHVL